MQSRLLVLHLALAFSMFGLGCSSGNGAATDGADGGVINGTFPGTDGGAFAGCTGVALERDGVFDLDLAAVKVSGEITAAGAPIPAAMFAGALVFKPARGTAASVPVVRGRYAVTLVPGTYDVLYAADATKCASAGVLPCTGGVLRAGIALGADGVLDVDVPVASVHGRATLKKQALPAAGAAKIAFTRVGDAAATVATSVSGASGASANYDVRLFPGAYAVSYAGGTCSKESAYPCNTGTLVPTASLMVDGVLDVDIPVATISGRGTLRTQPLPANGSATLSFAALDGEGAAGASGSATATVSNAAPTYTLKLIPGTYGVSYTKGTCAKGSAYPCNDGALKPRVTLASDGVLDLDIPAVSVRGRVTLKHKALPSTGVGNLAFTPASGGTPIPASVSGAAPDYALALFPGTYGVTYAGGTCAKDSAYPCNAGPLQGNVALLNDGVLDLDIPVVAVSGRATLNHGPLPATGSAGFGFAMIDGSSAGANVAADASYGVKLFPGTYAVSYAGGPCTSENPYPCNAGPLKASVPLTADGVLDLDIPMVTVRGRATLNGDALPAAGTATVAFAIGDAKSASTTVSAKSDAYTLRLLPGTYGVTYAAACTSDSRLPCGQGLVVKSVAVNADGVLDVDIPAIAVSGSVTVNGAALGDESAERGSAVFTGISTTGARSVTLGKTGFGSYRTTLLPGAYVISYGANGALCSGTSSPNVPCNDQVLKGCP